MTLSGAPKQKKRFNDKNLHYIKNAVIFDVSGREFQTENRIRYNDSPDKWKQSNLLNSDNSLAIAAGIKTRLLEPPVPAQTYLNQSHKRIANDAIRDY